MSFCFMLSFLTVMWKQFIGVLLLALVGFSMQIFDEGKIESSLYQGLEEYIQTGRKSNKLQETLNVLQFPGLFRNNGEKGIVPDLVCLTCSVGVDVIITARRQGASRDMLVGLLVDMCISLNIEPEHICNATINTHADTLIYIVDNTPNLTSQRVCSILLQNNGCKDRNREDWTIDIPPRIGVKNNAQRNPSKKPPLKVLQLTDIHYDPLYTIGSNAACKEPQCCQPGTKPANPEDAAGVWGDYRGCDTPWNVITDSLNHITAQHTNLDYFYYTGDIVDHKVWETNISHNTEIISKVLQLFKTTFGSLPVFPILGNHEPHPVNLFSPDGVNSSQLSTQWVFDLVAEKWQEWLPSETRETILRGGYYTVLVKPGFRIIALNSNVCFTYNWWLIHDDVDPLDQLKWLVEVLLEAERNGEAVHIISHVPTADGTCLQNWGKEYTKIVDRFANTIVAQFNGHTHKDQNVIFFNSSNPSQAVNVAFNGGSLTTYHNVNPNYIIYDIDQETLEVVDYEMWIYNITDANLTPGLNPNWYKLYSFKSAYGVDSLRPNDMAKLAENIASNRSLAEQYFRFKYREADAALAIGCDDDCHLSNICYMVTPYYGYTLQCDFLSEIWNSENTLSSDYVDDEYSDSYEY